ncbi:MAG: hypothetical protein PHE03_08660 [Bacteroidales bacterium]|nr:hypothetical protein [Bacteroidales bacterium]
MLFAMQQYSNNELLKSLIKQDQTALNYLYKRLFPKVNKMIFRLGGDYDNANDVFQESIIILYRKAINNEINETIFVEKYVVGICKLIWQKHLSKEKARSIKNEKFKYDLTQNEQETVNEYLLSKRKQLYLEHFKRLDKGCQNVLSAFLNGMNFAEIAKEQGFASDDYARRKKYLCKGYLVKSIKNDPNYHKLSSDYDDEFFEPD